MLHRQEVSKVVVGSRGKSCYQDGTSRKQGVRHMTKTLSAGWTHGETSMNMPRLSAGPKASCRMDETHDRGRRRAGVGGR